MMGRHVGSQLMGATMPFGCPLEVISGRASAVVTTCSQYAANLNCTGDPLKIHF